MNYDLSILIPARNEEWLAETVKDLIKNKRGKTEIIVVLDGAWAEPGIEDHVDVTTVYLPECVGQRAATNIAAKLSKAKYVMKVDAHCAFDEGFDVKLMEAVEGHDDWTIVPVMRNLHVFNWKCLGCGNETYQGPAPEGCDKCDVNTPDRFEKVLVWNPKKSPNSSAYKFTPDKLQFKYFGSLKDLQQKSGETIVETMSLQGSCFMLTREKYWELTICDESWGGWGQQGTEVALKTWLSGGRVVCHLGTWYAHMFRTSSGFAFPWNNGGVNQGRQQQKARDVSQDLFFNNKWDKQVRPLSWLIEKFWEPLQQEPDKEDDRKWTVQDLERLKRVPLKSNFSKGIIYYTDNRLNGKIAHRVQKQLRSIGLPIVSASLKPMDNMGHNIHVELVRGYLTMFKQILAALEASTADIIYFCEHDVLYPKEHFDFVPPTKDKFYYDINVYKMRDDGTALWVDECRQVSGIVVYRETAVIHYRERVALVEKIGFNRDLGFEPGTRKRHNWEHDFRSENFMSSVPMVDIRHTHNLTPNRWTKEQFRDQKNTEGWRFVDEIPGWGKVRDIL